MKKFQFRLEAVRRLRLEEERQAIAALQEIRRIEFGLHQEYNDLETQRGTWMQEFNVAAQTKRDVQDVLLIEQYLNALDAKQQFCKAQIVALQPRIEAAAEVVKKARMVRKQLDRMREMALVEYQKEWNQAEAKQGDELAILRGAYRLREEQEG